MVMDLPNCNWSEGSSKSVAFRYPEDRGSMFVRNIGQLHGITFQKALIYTDTHFVCKLKILQFLY
jgi:hypothetical protein